MFSKHIRPINIDEQPNDGVWPQHTLKATNLSFTTSSKDVCSSNLELSVVFFFAKKTFQSSN